MRLASCQESDGLTDHRMLAIVNATSAPKHSSAGIP